MIDISVWCRQFVDSLQKTYGNRIWFVGLQGSYGRGEATEDSDIDMVVVLDALSQADIDSYNRMLDNLPYREKACGFLSGKKELLCWNPADLFQLYYDTTPIIGNLSELESRLDVDGAIWMGLCNINHGCVHNMLYEKDTEVLKGLYKAAFFVIQAIVFRQMGKYHREMEALLNVSCSAEREILDGLLVLKSGEQPDFGVLSERLLIWSQSQLMNHCK